MRFCRKGRHLCHLVLALEIIRRWGMNHRLRLDYVMLLLLLGFISSCAQLPEYARPRFIVAEEDSPLSTDGFGYQPLSVEDFRAASLPPEYSQHNKHINAHSCISIRPSKDSNGRIVQANYQGHSFYVGSIPQLTFEAIFVPACSWWNPMVPEKKKAYVLEHEQIHFALAELSARRLSREARDELKASPIIGNSYGAVEMALVEKLRNMTHAGMESSLEEHTNFDEDTSLFYDPRAQRRWLLEAESRLAEEDGT